MHFPKMEKAKTRINIFKFIVNSENLSVMFDSAVPWAVQSMEFSRSEYWSW